MTQTSPKAEKPHYALLDGLRGVAAVMVVCYHVFEGFAASPVDQRLNHGYLAVEFFFVLSGFVIGYAYDDRWRHMTPVGFFRRRLIRLHPLVVMATVLGAVSYCLQGRVKWDGTPVSWASLAMTFGMGLLMIPSLPTPRFDIRGYGELFPLNGPLWSLFFEYIGNIAYALCLRRLSTGKLAIVVLLSAIGYAGYAVANGSGFYNMGVGWSLADCQLPGGLLRLSFCFSAGLLLSRMSMTRKDERGKGKLPLLRLPMPSPGITFLLCSIILCCAFSVPYIGSEANPWNAIHDAVCTILLFPLVVWLAASARPYGAKGATQKVRGPLAYLSGARLCKFLGDISYPLYVLHYPSMYLFYAWLWKQPAMPPFSSVWHIAVTLLVGSTVLAWLCLKWYDLPVRRWLQSK